jgi:exodeoxyribonuclease VII large subunit
MQRADDLEQRLSRGLRQLLSDRRAALALHRDRLWRGSPAALLRVLAIRHGELRARLQAAEIAQLRRAREHLLPLAGTLHAVSPLATLDRGYAIVSGAGGEILRDAAAAPAGSMIEARLARGRLRARVEPPAS